MTKGGQQSEKTAPKTSKKTSLKVKVTKTAKPKKAVHTIDKKEHIKKRRVKKKKASKAIDKKEEHTEKAPKLQVEKENTVPAKIQPRIIYEKVERDKLLIIRAGVTFVMLFIVIGWVYNMKQTLRMTDDGNVEQLTIENIKDLSSEVAEKIDQISEDINKVQSFAASNIENLAIASLSTTTTERSPFAEASTTIPLLIEKLNNIEASTSTKSSEEIELEILKKRIEELENKLSE